MAVRKKASPEQTIRQLKSDLDDLKKCCRQVERWIGKQVIWSTEVTKMLRAVNWAKLVTDYPSGGGANPPKDPPTYP